ncbi:MAG: FHA domain-containing protein [Pseudomonadota bacterium]
MSPIPAIGRLLLALTAMLLVTPPAAIAQLPTRSSMPDPVVLVVRVVGEDSLKPTTGVVIGSNSAGERLVIVAASFLDEPGDVYVLDGGTDFLSDSLEARRLVADTDTPEEATLAILAVPGLVRPAMRVTFNPPPTDHEVRLAAWPPATMMAGGTLPFWIPVNVAGAETGQPQTLVDGTRVPNLTGPLIDLCGQWAGMVIAEGEPGIQPGIEPRVLLNDEVLRIAEEMSVNLRLEACMQVAPAGGIIAPTTAVPPRSARAPEGPIAVILDRYNLGMGALVFLASALISGVAFWLLIKRRAANQKRARLKRSLQSETVTFSAQGLPTRSTRNTGLTRDDPTTFTPTTAPPGTSGWLRIQGKHADGRPLRAVTAVHEGKFQAVIGRAGVELAADGPGISRKHAVIVGEGGRLTISDLGSRNGTFVNGVRCLKDEIFYIDEDDKLLLGAAEVTVRLSPVKGPVT